MELEFAPTAMDELEDELEFIDEWEEIVVVHTDEFCTCTEAIS